MCFSNRNPIAFWSISFFKSLKKYCHPDGLPTPFDSLLTLFVGNRSHRKQIIILAAAWVYWSTGLAFCLNMILFTYLLGSSVRATNRRTKKIFTCIILFCCVTILRKVTLHGLLCQIKLDHQWSLNLMAKQFRAAGISKRLSHLVRQVNIFFFSFVSNYLYRIIVQ